jgi:hypothetical protein
MPIQMMARSDGLICPRVVCDFCGLPIDDAKQGNAEWQAADPTVRYTHKRCCYAFEQSHGGRAVWLTDDLTSHLGYLCHNTRFDRAAFEEAAAWGAA